MSDYAARENGELRTDASQGLVTWREFGRGKPVVLVNLGRPATDAEMTDLRAEHETALAEQGWEFFALEGPDVIRFMKVS